MTSFSVSLAADCFPLFVVLVPPCSHHPICVSDLIIDFSCNMVSKQSWLLVGSSPTNHFVVADAC